MIAARTMKYSSTRLIASDRSGMSIAVGSGMVPVQHHKRDERAGFRSSVLDLLQDRGDAGGSSQRRMLLELR